MDGFSPAPLGALTGLRVLSNAAIVTVHATFFFAMVAGKANWYTVLEKQWMARATLSTPLLIALNIFFALTSILAAVHLIPKLQASQTSKQALQVLCSYWWRRFVRLAPPMYLMLVLHACLWAWEADGQRQNNEEAHELTLAIFAKPELLRWLPASFFFVNNLTGQRSLNIVPWTWNLMVQAAFYLLFPLLLLALRPRAQGFRRRLAVTCSLMYAASVIQRLAVILLVDIKMPTSLLAYSNRSKSAGHSAEAVRCYTAFLYHIWTSGVGRSADLASGLFVYLWVTHPNAKLQAARNKRGSQIAAGIALLFLVATVSFPVVPQAAEPDPTMSFGTKLGLALVPLLVVSPFVVVAIMLYVILQPDAPSKALAAGLSGKAWQPFSDRSYSIYLLHFDVGVLLFKAYPLVELLGGVHSKAPLMVLPVVLYSASYVAAQFLDQLVDFIVPRVLGEPPAQPKSSKLKQ